MAYSYLVWQDHATTAGTGVYTMTENSDGTITLARAGTVVQQGTNRNAANFNNMEQGIMAANVAAIEALRSAKLVSEEIDAAVDAVMDEVDAAMDEAEAVVIEATLTNSSTYPFNNSAATIAIPTANIRQSTDYVVIAEVQDHEGGVVGDITITDKLVNSFKAAYDGSATSVTLKFYVIGGTSGD